MKGRPQTIASQITIVGGPSYLPISASATGSAGVRAGQRAETELLWFDREGHAIDPPLTSGRARYDSPELSPDNKQVLVADWSAGRRDLYSIALDSGVPTKLTFAPAQARYGIWSPDGATIGSACCPRAWRHRAEAIYRRRGRDTIRNSATRWRSLPPTGRATGTESCIT